MGFIAGKHGRVGCTRRSQRLPQKEPNALRGKDLVRRGVLDANARFVEEAKSVAGLRALGIMARRVGP
jgi:hypothetical protein